VQNSVTAPPDTTFADAALARRRTVHPAVFAVLYFPMGLMIGYPSVALGYLGQRAGLSVAFAAAIVGVAFFVHAFKFLWAPLGDYTLSRKTWYLLAVTVTALVIVALTVTPLGPSTVTLLSALVLLANLAGTFVAFATEGLMAHNTTPETRGRAGGWFQSGNQFGQTAGGGLGLSLMTHLPQPWMAGVTLGLVVLGCALVLPLLEEPLRPKGQVTVVERARDAARELRGVLRSRVGRVGLLLAALPIGTGAAQFLFGALGAEWHASADVVSFVLGTGGGIAIVSGCLTGGYLASRTGGIRAYAASCALSALAALFIALSPRNAGGYAAVTLAYTFTVGMCNASLTGMVLELIGEGAAATKINLFFAANTLAGLTMLRVDGAAHTRWATNGMLFTEIAVTAMALGVFAMLVIVMGRIRARSATGARA
jgi:PAT family beta-lactamase induction signal transducer AmpG